MVSFKTDPLFSPSWITINKASRGEIAFFTFNGDQLDSDHFNRLEIHIDMERVRNIEGVAPLLTHIIEHNWKRYSKAHRRKLKETRSEDLELMLQVGDLRDQEKLSFKKIAKRVFPEDNFPKSGERRASLYYRKYRELINGGYSYIGLILLGHGGI